MSLLFGQLDRAPRRRLPPIGRVLAAQTTPDLIASGGEVNLDLEAAGDSAAPPYKMVVYNGGLMRPKGYRVPVVVELSGLRILAGDRPALFSHDTDRPVGHGEVRVEAGKVISAGKMSVPGPDRDRIVESHREGFRWKSSMGAKVVRAKQIAAGDSFQANGRTFRGPAVHVTRADLYEVSFVTIAGDETSSASIAAAMADNQGASAMFEEWLQAKGFDADALSEDSRNFLLAQYNAEQAAKKPAAVLAGGNGDGNGGGGIDIDALVNERVQASLGELAPTLQAKADEVISAATARIELHGRIREICGEHGNPTIEADGGEEVDLAAHAIANDWSEDKTELVAMKRSRRPAPAIHSRGGYAPQEVVEASLCLAAGYGEEETLEAFGEEITDKASSPRNRITTFGGLMRDVCARAGVSLPPGVTGDDLIRAAFEADRDLQAAGVSSYSFGTLFKSITNKFAVQGFNAVEDTWRQIASVDPVSDFKQVEGLRLTGDFEYERIPADGQIPHAKMGDTPYKNQADTFAKMFAITRKDLRNDDLGIWPRTARQRLGRGGALAVNRLVWEKFLDNAAFFATGKKNYAAGATTALSIDSLTAAEKLFLDQTDEEGNPLGLMPTILLVPNSLHVKASQLMRDTEVRDTTANKKNTTGNPHAGKFRPVRSSYLNNAQFAGGSPDAWYLLCDPATMGVGVLQVVFLDGRQIPTVQQTEMDFRTLGIQMRGFHDFGAELQEHRCGVKMKGKA